MLTERYADRIRGVLSCFDRVVIMGTLPDICHAQLRITSGPEPAEAGESCDSNACHTAA